MYYVYIIRCSDNSLYTGITNHLQQRMKDHYYKTKKGAKYTRSHSIISIESIWVCNDRSQASKLEHYIKKQTKEKKEFMLHTDSIDPSQYLHKIEMTLEECLSSNVE